MNEEEAVCVRVAKRKRDGHHKINENKLIALVVVFFFEHCQQENSMALHLRYEQVFLNDRI